jgi:hypothetical protein
MPRNLVRQLRHMVDERHGFSGKMHGGIGATVTARTKCPAPGTQIEFPQCRHFGPRKPLKIGINLWPMPCELSHKSNSGG